MTPTIELEFMKNRTTFAPIRYTLNDTAKFSSVILGLTVLNSLNCLVKVFLLDLRGYKHNELGTLLHDMHGLHGAKPVTSASMHMIFHMKHEYLHTH